jgi:antitoxin HigA-1
MRKKLIEIEHPGIMLKEDFLDDLGIKPGAFAKAIAVDRSAIKNIIEGKRSITADMALRFGLFFNMSAGFWLNLQKDYELRIAERERLPEFEKVIQPYEPAHS